AVKHKGAVAQVVQNREYLLTCVFAHFDQTSWPLESKRLQPTLNDVQLVTLDVTFDEIQTLDPAVSIQLIQGQHFDCLPSSSLSGLSQMRPVIAHKVGHIRNDHLTFVELRSNR